ncbi:MAG TPA: CsgG/HfaB family protein [Candidatus Polarisedimenticolia bacterium]|nr:CsgG/HfaB family protein [Candidatus Polarisedimenticolia bacterium]
MTLKGLKSLSAVAALVAVSSLPAIAESAQARRDEKMAEIPVCQKRLGSIAVVEPETDWWREAGLGSPEALLKVFVRQSNCFALVDRGKGMQALQAERSLAANGNLRGGSNLGQGQIRAADYVLVPDLISSNSNAGGHHIGGLIGGLTGHHGVGVALGGLNLKKKTADVVLTVTDVRSSEQVAAVEGHAKKTDIGWGAGGKLFKTSGFGGAGATGYSDTEIGQVITLAYLQAYTDMIAQLGALPDNASDANAPQAVVMNKPGRMYATPDTNGQVIKPLETGTMLYPTGQKHDVLWEVTDELGEKGWVSSLLFQLAR